MPRTAEGRDAMGEAGSRTIETLARQVFSICRLDPCVAKCERIVNDALGREYDVYIITSEDGNEYVLKHSKHGNEVRVYEEILARRDLPIPKYYGRVDDPSEGMWFLCEMAHGTRCDEAEPSLYRPMAEAVARCHAEFWGCDLAGFPLRKDCVALFAEYLSIAENEAAKAEPRLSKDVLTALRDAADRLSSQPQTLIHDDLLPLNILARPGSATIVDWEMASKGCYAMDLGRLLGDLKSKDAEIWIKPEHHRGILQAYHRELLERAHVSLPFDDLEYDVRCGQLWNYAVISLVHHKRGWKLSRWYERNLDAMIQLCRDLRE